MVVGCDIVIFAVVKFRDRICGKFTEKMIYEYKTLDCFYGFMFHFPVHFKSYLNYSFNFTHYTGTKPISHLWYVTVDFAGVLLVTSCLCEYVRMNELLLLAAVVPSRSAKMSAVETVAIESSKAASAADSPKIDNRKRTRQSLQSPIPEASPATATSTPSSGKRSRRI